MTAPRAGRRRTVGPAGPPPAERGSEYAVLSREVRQSGLLKRRPGYYSVEVGANLLLPAAGWTAFALIGQSWWQLVTAAFLAVMFAQTGFIGHEAGHHQIAASKRVNSVLGHVHADLLIGLSYGWWIAKHNKHHSHPNHVDRDLDIADGAIAFTGDQARVRRGAYVWLARHQAWLFFPMPLLEGLALHAVGGPLRPELEY
ncbi:fatty acid desaturase [Streptomyces sp. NPDC088766]|uniref:fatty acid desaturase n=1 Tax=Streptomyces sp. NPDC088766 TaxID=3365893 RepID=UPI0037FC9995